jgi:hypothetical protein
MKQWIIVTHIIVNMTQMNLKLGETISLYDFLRVVNEHQKEIYLKTDATIDSLLKNDLQWDDMDIVEVIAMTENKYKLDSQIDESSIQQILDEQGDISVEDMFNNLKFKTLF